MTARTDRVTSIAGSRETAIVATDFAGGGVRGLLATGRLTDFRCCLVDAQERGGGLAIDPRVAAALGAKSGDRGWWVRR
jgi:arginine N-succinyltransferase